MRLKKVGVAFGDHIKTERLGKRRTPKDTVMQMRGFVLVVFCVSIVVLLTIRLISLQLVQGAYYRSLSDSNRIRTTTIHAPRGIITDRSGTPLVMNKPGFRKLVNGKIVLLTQEDALPLLAKGDPHLEIDTLRAYPFADSLSHVLGYVGQISPDQLHDISFAEYQAGDLIGKSGIEKQYEQNLRGTDGKELVEVDALGRVTRTLGKTDPISGQNIPLTIDANLQQTSYAAMKGVAKGALIVSTPTGEILAMISKPSFDPNLFTQDLTYKVASDSAYHTVSAVLLDSTNQPLLNRAISGVYPPGSTFKLITAAAGLQDHTIDSNYSIVDTGILRVGAFSFANWYYTDYGRTEAGPVNVVRAITRSNDIFFYKLAELVGVDNVSKMAKQFGVGSLLGIDLPGEENGIVPTQEWKQKTIHESWYLGDTYQYGIGQGYLLTTPLQVNAWTQAVANAGTLYQPHLLKTQLPKIAGKNIMSDDTFSLLRQGMIGACDTGGVAWPLFQFQVKNAKLKIDGKNILPVPSASSSSSLRKVVIACKTGTAQHGDENTLPHAWITLFAPAYNPQIVMTVLVESSGEGSNIAAPIAKEVLTNYFSTLNY